MIAHGLDIWDHAQEETKDPRLTILQRYGACGACFSTTQGAERANKDQNLAASNQRGEANVSQWMVAGSGLKEMCL